MPATEAQKRAQKKWNAANKERVAQSKAKWIQNNRDSHNESCRLSMKRKWDLACEFKAMRFIKLI
jgi:hypothetical protein